MRLSEIAQVLTVPVDGDKPLTGVKIDARQINHGDLFIAIKGARFDGHDFIDDAIKKGAGAVVVSTPVNKAIPQLIVEDTILALGEIARWHRLHYDIPIIALTGSNGKTTVKEMIAAILPQPSLATQGNWNNHIGVPLSLLNLNQTHRYAVFELGANHPGEIAYTAGLVRPKVALINNIAPAHIEGFGSIDGVARAKGELYQALCSEGSAIVNEDSNYAHYWDDYLKDRRVLRFSQNKAADIYAENHSLDDKAYARFDLVIHQHRLNIRLCIPGRHSISNALAAASCCFAAGISPEMIQQGLNQFNGVKGRMAFQRGLNESLIVDDTYNANLESTLAAIEVLSQLAGEKILILGDMGELGVSAEEHHHQIGLKAKEKGINKLFTCGSLSQFASQSFGRNGLHFESQHELLEGLKPLLTKNTVVLAKGSRAAQMECVINSLIGA